MQRGPPPLSVMPAAGVSLFLPETVAPGSAGLDIVGDAGTGCRLAVCAQLSGVQDHMHRGFNVSVTRTFPDGIAF